MDKKVFSRFFISATIAEMKASLNASITTFRTLEVENWSVMLNLIKKSIVLVDLVREMAVNKTAPNIRPRRGSQAAHMVISHIKSILDVKIRVACHQLDDLSANLDKLTPQQLEGVGHNLAKLKEFDTDFAYLALIEPNDARPEATIVKEMEAFFVVLRDSDTLGKRLGPQFLPEIQKVPRPDLLAGAQTPASPTSPRRPITQPVEASVVNNSEDSGRSGLKSSRSNPASMTIDLQTLRTSESEQLPPQSKSAPSSPRQAITTPTTTMPETTLRSGAIPPTATDSAKKTGTEKKSSPVTAFVAGLFKKVTKSTSKRTVSASPPTLRNSPLAIPTASDTITHAATSPTLRTTPKQGAPNSTPSNTATVTNSTPDPVKGSSATPSVSPGQEIKSSQENSVVSSTTNRTSAPPNTAVSAINAPATPTPTPAATATPTSLATEPTHQPFKAPSTGLLTFGTLTYQPSKLMSTYHPSSGTTPAPATSPPTQTIFGGSTYQPTYQPVSSTPEPSPRPVESKPSPATTPSPVDSKPAVADRTAAMVMASTSQPKLVTPKSPPPTKKPTERKPEDAASTPENLTREEELQRAVINKFNLEDRIAPGSTQPSQAGGSRARRKAAIFTKATDRYSQLHSNAEAPEDLAKFDADNEVNIYDEPEEGNIKLESLDAGVVEVAHGSLNQLVKYLTSEKLLDGKFVQTFLLTYTSFTTPAQLLTKLVQRYHGPKPGSTQPRPSVASALSTSSHPAGITTTGSRTTLISNATATATIGADPVGDPETERRKAQLRVVNTIKKWLDMCFLDFNDELIGKVFEFVDQLKIDGNASLASILDNVLLTKLMGISKKKEFHHEAAPPAPIIPRVPTDQLNFEDIDTLELARQITLLDHGVYTSIRSSELLRQAWNKPQLKHRSPRVLDMIQRFNQISHWIAGVVVRTESLKERVKVFERCIAFAQTLRDLQNFNTLMAVLSGLNNSAVFRLNQTKDELSKASEKTLAKLTTLMSSHQNFATYKAELLNCPAPAVPYLGIYLTNLTFTEDGNPDLVAGLVNFKKRKLVSKIIVEIQKFQEGKKYNFTKVDSIVDFLDSLPEEEDEELYNLSLIREPRVAKK